MAAYKKMRPLIMKQYIGYHSLGMDADDLWSEVLIDGIENYHDYDPSRSSLRTWVVNRGIWCIKTILRKNGREPYKCDVSEVDVPAKEAVAPRDDVYNILMGLSEELPTRERVVFKYFLNGYSFEKVGKRLGVTRQRVYTLFKAAIRRLRRSHREKLESIDIRKSRYRR